MSILGTFAIPCRIGVKKPLHSGFMAPSLPGSRVWVQKGA
jgi:hypothetical protein